MSDESRNIKIAFVEAKILRNLPEESIRADMLGAGRDGEWDDYANVQILVSNPSVSFKAAGIEKKLSDEAFAEANDALRMLSLFFGDMNAVPLRRIAINALSLDNALGIDDVDVIVDLFWSNWKSLYDLVNEYRDGGNAAETAAEPEEAAEEDAAGVEEASEEADSGSGDRGSVTVE